MGCKSSKPVRVVPGVTIVGEEPLGEGEPLGEEPLGEGEPLGEEPLGVAIVGEPLGEEPLGVAIVGEPLGEEPLGVAIVGVPLGEEPLNGGAAAPAPAPAPAAETFLALAKPSTAGVALRLIEQKRLVVSEDILAWMSAGQAERLEQIEAGQKYSRTSAQQLCEEHGGRLAYRREIVDETTKKLIINDGKPMDGPHGGHTWAAVLDGDPAKNNEGIGWVQLGVADGAHKVGRNHKEIHRGDNSWGGPGDAHGGIKCKFIWCTIGGPPLAGLVLSKAPAAIKLVDYLLSLAPAKLVPTAIVAACTPASAKTALRLLYAYPNVTLDTVAVEPLVAQENKKLRKLALDESAESCQLVDVLMTKSAPIQAAVTSVEMLRAALPPPAARLLALIRAEKGDAALLEAIDAVDAPAPAPAAPAPAAAVEAPPPEAPAPPPDR